MMETIQTQCLWPAFDNAVLQSQRNFRKIMTAMAEPGQIVSVDDLSTDGQLSSAMFVFALSLIDQDVSVWLSPQLRSAALMDNLRFHCGCQITQDSRQADFVMTTLDELDDLSVYLRGVEEYPDRFATLLVETDGLQDRGSLVLSGPGIKTTRTLGIQGFSSRQGALLNANRQQFPMGYDLLFTCKTELVGLPRSCHVDYAPDPCHSTNQTSEGQSLCM